MTEDTLKTFITRLGDILAVLIYYFAAMVGSFTAMFFGLLPIILLIELIRGNGAPFSGRDVFQVLVVGLACGGMLRIPYAINARDESYEAGKEAGHKAGYQQGYEEALSERGERRHFPLGL